ncbi:outer membrane protein [Bradyrhizobium sp.]|uniref:outer membrane protein n=1 Tax=Bradyrhizobium sp. TaxID=376 RepID=UPI004037E682
MKKILLAAVAVAALAAAMPAAAADLGARYNYNKAPSYAAPIWTWTGFYVGAHLGGAFGNDNNFGGLALSDSDARFMGGVQAGADWQFSGNWVVGAEGQYSWLSRNNASAVFPGGYVYSNDQRGLGSITARLGYSFGPALAYVKGGYAYADNRDIVTLGGVPIAFALDSGHNHGWTIGGGAEYMFAPSWSVKAEYQYYNFGDSRFTAPAALVSFGSFHNDQHAVKAGVNYRFNFTSPVVARY